MLLPLHWTAVPPASANRRPPAADALPARQAARARRHAAVLPVSSKYLFADEIVLDGERIRINKVDNFQYADQDAINICFATTQGLHMDMWITKENGMSFDDFDEQKVVLISDEAHHLNVDTRKKLSADEESSYHSWEQTVKNIFNRVCGRLSSSK